MNTYEMELSDQAARLIMSLPDERFGDLTVGTLANMIGVERSKLSRQFKKQMDVTLESFIFTEKMTRAAFMLRQDGTVTIKEVSNKVGFLTSDYFSRLFKRHYGILPAKYREFKCNNRALLANA